QIPDKLSPKYFPPFTLGSCPPVPQSFPATRFQSGNRLSSRPLLAASNWPCLTGRRRLRSSKMAARNYRCHLRAALAGLDFQPPAELFHSFFHSYNSYASAFAHRGAVQHSVRYSPPVIAD